MHYGELRARARRERAMPPFSAPPSNPILFVLVSELLFAGLIVAALIAK